MTPFVTPEAIRRELRRLGYQEFERDGRLGVTWTDPTNMEHVAVVVPRERDATRPGFDETISSATERIAWITREPLMIVRRRLAAALDQLELRVVHDLTSRNTIPALKAPDLVDGFVRLIKNGARTEFNGARADHRGPTGSAYTAAIDQIHLLAPEPGSFRLIAVAIEPEQTSLEEGGSTSRARQALEATARSLEVLAEEERPESELGSEDVERLVDGGVSRQLLKAVQELAVAQTAGLNLEFRMTSAVPDVAVATAPAVINDHHLTLARELNKRLSLYEPRHDFRLVGWVEMAKADAQSLEGFPTGTVIVRTKVEGRQRDVLVELGKQQFPQIKPGISEVEMTGTLERISGRWHLLKPRGVKIKAPATPLAPPTVQPRLLGDGTDDASS